MKIAALHGCCHIEDSSEDKDKREFQVPAIAYPMKYERV
jgi:hypothetical protein